MKNNKNLIITLLVILGISIAILFFIKDKQKKEAKKLLEDAAKATQNPASVNNPGSSATPPFVAIPDVKPIIVSDVKSDTIFPINIGSTGKAVAILQVALNSAITGVLSEKDVLKLTVLGQKMPLEKQLYMGLTTKNATGYFPLKKGMKNKYVAALQVILGLPIDGVFGSGTENALQSFTNATTLSYTDYFKMYRSVIVKV